ncbi:MAG: hypothetical protein LBR12_05090, partial [Opitutaceae bacterium]|nr:hypothetical protein [Opitutaceae bacterium]
MWINGNVSREGIRRDLEDMRRAGITGAMLFDGSLYLPKGPVLHRSDEWHALIQFALRVAEETGVAVALM